jgi:hypothetical protein
MAAAISLRVSIRTSVESASREVWLSGEAYRDAGQGDRWALRLLQWRRSWLGSRCSVVEGRPEPLVESRFVLRGVQ